MAFPVTSRARRIGKPASAAAVAFVLLAGCASTPPAPVVDRSSRAPVRERNGVEPVAAAASGLYRVERGDTLYSIAFRNGLDYRDLARWNGIGAPYTIYAGQSLRLEPARTTPATSTTAHGTASNTTAIAKGAGTGVAGSAGRTTSAHGVPPPAAPLPGAFEPVPSEPAAGSPATTSTPPATVATAGGESTPVPPAPDAAAGSTAPVPPSPPPAVASTAAPSVPPAPSPGSKADDDNGVPAAVDGWTWPANGQVIVGFVPGDPTRQGIDIAGRAGDPVRAAAAGTVVYSGNGLIGYGELIIVKHSPGFLSAYGHNRKRLVHEGERVAAGQVIAEMGSTGASRDELHFEIRKNGKPVDPLAFLPRR